MDQNPITLDDSSKASGHMDLHPNRDEIKGKSEFPIKASPTKGIELHRMYNRRKYGY